MLFLDGLGPPKIHRNHQKLQKIAKKSKSKKHILFNIGGWRAYPTGKFSRVRARWLATHRFSSSAAALLLAPLPYPVLRARGVVPSPPASAAANSAALSCLTTPIVRCEVISRRAEATFAPYQMGCSCRTWRLGMRPPMAAFLCLFPPAGARCVCPFNGVRGAPPHQTSR